MEKHDCVMPYTRNGMDSTIMSCGEHLEIEYVIASLKKYCSSWLGRIFIVGSEPPDVIKEDVIYIPCGDPYTHCKDSNIIHKVRYACENIPDLSDDFIMISDDQIVTRECEWSDFQPRILRMFSSYSDRRWAKEAQKVVWRENLYKTLLLFPKDTAAVWQPHIWSPMNKYKFVDMCNTYDYQHSVACIIFTLYYNFVKQPIVNNFDHMFVNAAGHKELMDRRIVQKKIESLYFGDNIPTHLSWSDKAFSNFVFRYILDCIVGFNKK